MLLFETAIKAVIIHDGIKIYHGNPRALDLLGYPTLEALRGKDLKDIVAGNCLPLSQDRVQRLREKPHQNLPEVRLQLLRADGSTFWATVRTYSAKWLFDALGHQLEPGKVVEIVFYSSMENIVNETGPQHGE